MKNLNKCFLKLILVREELSIERNRLNFRKVAIKERADESDREMTQTEQSRYDELDEEIDDLDEAIESLDGTMEKLYGYVRIK